LKGLTKIYMPTMMDVAQRAGVSVATVSYVLNGNKPISTEVVERVQEAMRATGYQPNSVARALRTGQSRTLGLVVPDLTNPSFPQFIQAIESRARADGYATVLMESRDEETETQNLTFLTQRGVDGLIWMLGSDHLPSNKPSVPTVILDYAPTGWFSVHADDYGGGRMQARFAKQTLHKNVALLWGPRSLTSIQERRRGFHDESGSELNVLLELETNFSLELPKNLERKLESERGKYSFLACGNDMLAIAAIKALKTIGINVPEEVSVIGFDDTPLSTVIDPPLTTIAQPIKKLGTFAVELLLAQLQDKDILQPNMVIPVSLVQRSSTKPFVHKK
jgi:LacI family transcriptional regulator